MILVLLLHLLKLIDNISSLLSLSVFLWWIITGYLGSAFQSHPHRIWRRYPCY